MAADGWRSLWCTVMGLSSVSNAAHGGDLPRLGVAMIGHAFMGRAHGNAWRQANHFFDLPYAIVPAVVGTAVLSGVRRRLGLPSPWPCAMSCRRPLRHVLSK